MKNSPVGRIALLFAISALAGCASIEDLFSNDSDSNADPVETFSSFDGQIVQAVDFDRLGGELDETEESDLPSSGSVDYAGVAGFAYAEAPQSAVDYEVMADGSLRADFEDGDVTGTFDNFSTFDDVDMDGTLTVTEGTIDGTSLTGNVIGDFVDGDDAVIWDLELIGQFYGDDGEYIYGTANGTANNGGSESTDVFGEFAVGLD